MRLRDLWSISLSSATSSPVRAVLTLLSLSVSVGAILCVLAVGEAGRNAVSSELWRMGIRRVTLTCHEGVDEKDTALLRAVSASPATLLGAGQAEAQYEDKTISCAMVITDAQYPEAMGLTPTAGRFFTQTETARAARVCAVNQALYDTLTGGVIWVNGTAFAVVGAIDSTPLAGGSHTIYLPSSTAYALYGIRAQTLSVDAPTGDHATSFSHAIADTLSTLSGKTFTPSLPDNEIKAAKNVLGIFTSVLFCVSALCAVLGGLGVMSLMLVNVQRRTREIGVLKALGIQSRDVALLFLLEGGLYSLLGCLSGAVLGIALTNAAQSLIGVSASISAHLFLPAIAGAACVGLGFCVLPARRAAALDPVEALR